MSETLNGSLKNVNGAGRLNTQIGVFAVFTIIAGYLAYGPLSGLLSIGAVLGYGPIDRVVQIDAGADSDYYSHILLIPFVTAYFLFLDRRSILQHARYSYMGLGVAACGLLGYGAALTLRRWLGPNDFASVATAGALVFWWGGFLLAFGPQAFRVARFPLLFMLFVIPIPLFLLDWFIYILQVASTEVTEWLFQLTGTDYIRNGFIYRLPNITIQVARECSGIRSSIALIITGVLAGHLFLRTGWRKFFLVVAMLPFTVLKNGVRIVTLSLLAIYVDTKFITDSFLHHSGGFVFYLPALGLLALLLWWFRKQERRG
ncbi:MAG TPA: exosortase/archaeosortase family protein [Syntrophorhabdales bacterium]|nr:exosortase/archaeosortase family protein [Syntrophorhabdales bacterium]